VLGSDMAGFDENEDGNLRTYRKQSSNKFYSLGYGVVSQFKES
jgi:hypothetical protein